MKTLFLSVLFFGICIGAQAQSKDNPYNGLGLSKNQSLTPEQAAKIRELNQGVGLKYKEIGQDRTLTGREKGMKKRELSLKHKQEIMDILNEEQVKEWNESYNKNGRGIKNSLTDKLDDELDVLEEKYEKEKKAIEKNQSLGKYERERKKDELKAKYKEEKERLKNEKDRIKSTLL